MNYRCLRLWRVWRRSRSAGDLAMVGIGIAIIPRTFVSFDRTRRDFGATRDRLGASRGALKADTTTWV